LLPLVTLGISQMPQNENIIFGVRIIINHFWAFIICTTLSFYPNFIL
jgi:hypothetical protein